MIINDFKLLVKLLKPLKVYNLYHFKPIEGFNIDSRQLKVKEGFIAILGKYHDGHEFILKAVAGGARAIIAQKYIPTKPKVPYFVVNDTQESLGRIAEYIRIKKKPLVYGITGSLGKTTTKEMLSFLLEPHLKVLKNKRTENNFLGVGKTILSLRDEKVMILELGTNAKGEIETLAHISKPDIGVITFIKPVHLEGLKSMRGIYEEKISLFKAKSGMKAVLNRDDPYLRKVHLKQKTYWFGQSEDNNVFAKLIVRNETDSIFLVQNKYRLMLPSNREFFITNALAAILSAHLLGISLKRLVERMNEFKDFPSMRMELQRLKGFLVLNDAYNANPYSFSKVLETVGNYDSKKIAVVGDMLELGKKSRYYHEQIAYKLAKGGFDYCFTIGEQTFYLNKKLRQLGHKRAFHFDKTKAIADFINKKFKDKVELKKRYLIFLKASRKMKLEEILGYLK
ncbi:MAG: UDP-N-acetylmuramoyl-tripeptide--D-alanyl-D-alanine ligase [Candidatus Omnitrophica bacterium]|jgi:UDP-N-acetylmuramoyl-tripeptide--D-alanyl-D-alanine ligase|nr:UDP-N-acetylmuramoyl-tripeptide--D-alanyl-D-alanine ligase [Candidatus Omnitrophota bacterium]